MPRWLTRAENEEFIRRLHDIRDNSIIESAFLEVRLADSEHDEFIEWARQEIEGRR